MKSQSECGRTLLEVIGVLAVVGLLTVGTMKWFESAATRMAVNDLVEEARKRALAVDKNGRFSSHPMTKGMFDQASGYGENRSYSNVTAAGYAVGDNQIGDFGVRVDDIDANKVVLVPVGKNGNIGKPVSKNVCLALLGRIVDDNPAIGDIVVIQKGNDDIDDDDDCANPSDIIKIGIRIGRASDDDP